MMRYSVKSNIQISVVIATHNRDEYLKEAVNSAINQTYPPAEILISDNVPNKSTKLLIEELSAKSKISIKYIGHKMKGRSSISMNLAVSKSIGSYVAFLNDDDTWEQSYLEKAFQLISYNNSKIIYTWFTDWHKDEKKKGKKLIEGLQMRDFLLSNPGCVVSNLIVERDLFIGLGGFDEYIHPSNDKDFVIRTLYFCYDYDVLKENLVNIRRHSNKRETDITREFLIGIKKFFKKHYTVADFRTKVKFWIKYWLMFVKSKI